MSTIEDTFHSKHDDLIAIKWGPKKSFTKINQYDQEKDIDLSTPQIITVERHADTLWPKTIEATVTRAKGIEIKEFSNCTVSQIDTEVWRIAPNEKEKGKYVEFFQLEISLKKQGYDWGDPNVTVTVGEPPPGKGDTEDVHHGKKSNASSKTKG